MERVSLEELAAATGGTLSSNAPRRQLFAGVSLDSRQVAPGEVFWAIRGPRFDGHDFLDEAFRRGAVAAVVEKSVNANALVPPGPTLLVKDGVQALAAFAGWYRTLLDALVIGITGSVGKTTTRELVFSALGGEAEASRSRRNYNNHLGVPLTLLGLSQRHRYAVVEMGADRVGDIAALCRCARPEFGIVTALGVAHVATFGSREAIVRAKGELVESLSRSGAAILPGDSPAAAHMAAKSKARAVTVGTSTANTHQVSVLHTGPNRLAVSVDGQCFEAAANGRHFAVPIGMAVIIARTLGRSDSQIAQGLKAFEPVAGRCRVVLTTPWTLVDDTYNANPDSMRAALDALATWPASRRRVFVCGDMYGLGPETAKAHVELGRSAAVRDLDLLVAIGDQAGLVVQGALREGMPSSRIAMFADRESAAAWLASTLAEGDVVWAKGSRPMMLERLMERLQAAASQAASRRAA